ncbi:MAG TPA: Hsp20/alpha crystallin family protein [Acidimicrobiales bacterium]|nr:Hsp20/alpha crystallin family protein [Acidimicrobiales bacterium]
MMLMRSDPFRQLDRLADQMFGTAARPASMPMDAYRRGDRFVVHFDLPGVDPEQVELTVERNTLMVRAERSWTPAEGDELVASERPQGVFSRQLLLGEGLDTDRIEASYDAGVLTLTIPVAEKAKPRRVSVTTGETQQSIPTAPSS